MSYKVGDDVIVEFKGHRTTGEVVETYKTSGYILCRIHIDPMWDYGETSADLDPEPFVCIRENRVHPAAPKANNEPDQT